MTTLNALLGLVFIVPWLIGLMIIGCVTFNYMIAKLRDKDLSEDDHFIGFL